ncbi:very-short-patch-repair endonuclease [Azorhizobium sp. AG788]|nr:very-short-patch-repair endonuclease [Azorhizobium sp. AG788]
MGHLRPAVLPPSLPSPARGEGSAVLFGEARPPRNPLPPPLRGRAGEGGNAGPNQNTLSAIAPEADMPNEERPTAHRPISPRLNGNAKTLRREMTDAERTLWQHLRAHRLEGAPFRRQAPMGRYVADFVCHPARLIVELDGGQHGGPEDQARDNWFAAPGYAVVRYWNNDVLGNLGGVLEDLSARVIERVKVESVLPPSPTLPRKGGGGDDLPLPTPKRLRAPLPPAHRDPSPLEGEGREGGKTAGPENARSETSPTPIRTRTPAPTGGHAR